MTFAGTTIKIRLTREGVQELVGLVPENRSFTVEVVEEDELGLWVRSPRETADAIPVSKRTAMLVKWNYFSTPLVEYIPGPPAERRRMGFYLS